MDAAQIVQPPSGSGPYLAVYHTALDDGRFHAAVATSTDLRTWHRRHDFGPGTSQPSLAAAGEAAATGSSPTKKIRTITWSYGPTPDSPHS